jgi:protein gp37
VSAGCAHCYAESLMKRFGKGDLWGPGRRQRTSSVYWKQPFEWNRRARLDHLGGAFNRPRVFCASLADVFEDHPQVAEWRKDLWEVIDACRSLDWLLLTKRPENIDAMMPRDIGLHVWLGTSVEDQNAADRRIPHLLAAGATATVRFLSVEPMLGPVQLPMVECLSEPLDPDGIHWVICGGESGAGFRPMDIEWARALHVQCMAHRTPFWFKQASALKSGEGEDALGRIVQEAPPSRT